MVLKGNTPSHLLTHLVQLFLDLNIIPTESNSFHIGQATLVLQGVLATAQYLILVSIHEPSALITAKSQLFLSSFFHSHDATFPWLPSFHLFTRCPQKFPCCYKCNISPSSFRYFVPSPAMPVLNQNSPENSFSQRSNYETDMNCIYFRLPMFIFLLHI